MSPPVINSPSLRQRSTSLLSPSLLSSFLLHFFLLSPPFQAFWPGSAKPCSSAAYHSLCEIFLSSSSRPLTNFFHVRTRLSRIKPFVFFYNLLDKELASNLHRHFSQNKTLPTFPFHPSFQRVMKCFGLSLVFLVVAQLSAALFVPESHNLVARQVRSIHVFHLALPY